MKNNSNMTLEQFEQLNLKEIGRGVRYLRKSNGLSLQALADMTDTQKYWLSNLENGKKNFGFTMLNKILYHFNITFIDFLEVIKKANDPDE